jgi:hypothetical protein
MLRHLASRRVAVFLELVATEGLEIALEQDLTDLPEPQERRALTVKVGVEAEPGVEAVEEVQLEALVEMVAQVGPDQMGPL